MNISLQQFHFSPDNSVALIFLPGYTKAFKAPIVDALISAYIARGDIDILGLDPDYTHDTMDDFRRSEASIHDIVTEFHQQYPTKKIIAVAKSLGGALCLHNLNSLPVAGVVVLGSSLALGWPQRISSLEQEGRESYAQEWHEPLSRITIPTHILSGSEDHLADNDFLEHITKSNTNISLTMIPHAGHGLQDMTSKLPCTEICTQALDTMIAQIQHASKEHVY